MGFSIGGFVGDLVDGAGDVVSNLDPTSSNSWVGGAIGSTGRDLFRQGIGTSAAILTGGASVLAGQRGWLPTGTFGARVTGRGFITGAGIGLAVGGASRAVKAGGAAAINVGGQALDQAFPPAPPPSSFPDTGPIGLFPGEGGSGASGTPIGATPPSSPAPEAAKPGSGPILLAAAAVAAKFLLF